MKKILLAAVSALMLNACTSEAPKVDNIITAVDLSISRDSNEKARYKEIVEKSVMKNLSQTSRFIVLPIDFGSQTAGQEIFFKDFSVNVYHSQYAGMQGESMATKIHRDSLVAAQRQFSQSFDKFITARTEYGDGTDIFGALRVAQGYRIVGVQNTLILLSDMVHSGKGDTDNLQNKLKSLADVGRVVKKTEKLDLRYFRIIVITGAKPQMSPESYNLLKEFWTQYFLECKANLIEYSSGSISRLEQLMADRDVSDNQ